MKKIVLSVIIVFSLLAPALVFTTSASASTCSIKMPETLLSLYRASDGIYVGRYTGQEEGKALEEAETYTTIEIKKHFDISQTVKGKELRAFTQFDTEYREIGGPPKGFDTVEEIQESQAALERSLEQTEIEEIEESPALKPGDDVLLFVQRDEETNRLELTDYRDGIKVMPRKNIAVYEARIKELESILTPAKPSVEKLVDWLVSCAEDPVTRWEGTYELESSFSALEYQEERAAQRKAKAAAERNPIELLPEKASDEEDNAAFAKAMSEFHRQSLANILLNAEFQAPERKPGENGYVAGNRELLSLVARWDNTRVAWLLLNRLRAESYSARENSEMMESVAAIVDDDKVAEIAEKYGDVHYEDDDAVVENKDEEAQPIQSKDKHETRDLDQSSAGPGKTSAIEPLRKAAKSPEKPTVTYKQFRSDLIAKFVQRAEFVMANPKGVDESDGREDIELRPSPPLSPGNSGLARQSGIRPVR